MIAYKTTLFGYHFDDYRYTYPLEDYFSEEEFKDYFFYIDKYSYDTWTYVKDSWSNKPIYERKLNAKIRVSDQELVYIWIEEWNKATGQAKPVTIWQWTNSLLTSKERLVVILQI